MTSEKLFKVNEIADRFGVTRATIYNWIDKGMPVIRNHGITRFELDKVLEWLKKEEIN